MKAYLSVSILWRLLMFFIVLIEQMNLKERNGTLTIYISYMHGILLPWFGWCSWLLLGYVGKHLEIGTLCYWCCNCWFSIPTENHCNVLSIGQFYRYFFGKNSHGVSPPSKVWGNLSPKKNFTAVKTFLDKFMGGAYRWGESWLYHANGAEVSQLHFPVIWTL